MTHPLLDTPPTTAPAHILRLRDRQYSAELIAVALRHFDLFSWLAENEGATTTAIREQFDLAARPADVLITLCRASGFITTDAEDRNALTPLAQEHLVAGSPWFLGPYYAPIHDTPITAGFLKVLKSGKPANWQAKDDGDDWHESMLDEEFAKGFTDLMNSRGTAFGQVLAQALTAELGNRKRVLDIGGGSGIYSSTLVAAHPHLNATVLEQPPVDSITLSEVARHGLSDRVAVVTGDMFKDAWPAGHDVLLMSNLLHDWDFPEVRVLLEKAHATLPSGGLLVIHEVFIADDKRGPLPAAEYSALLMNITQGKCYTAREYGEILEELGFEVGPYHDTIADRGYMTAVKR